MGVHFQLHGLNFIWDSEKAAGNLIKHQVGFAKACEIFFDPFFRIEEAGDAGEMRMAAIGLSEDWALLFVVHVIREEETIRLISARPATAMERRLYEECD